MHRMENMIKKEAIEVEAVTVEKAITKALKTLNAEKKDVTVQVLKEEHKGLFGMRGAELAKIRVTIKQEVFPK